MDLRSLLAELSSNWLKRRGTPAMVPMANVIKATKPLPRSPSPTTRMRPAHKPKPPRTRDLASNM